MDTELLYETSTYISRLKELDIHVQLKGEQLKVTTPGRKVEEDVLRELRNKKSDIITFLKQNAGNNFHHIPLIEEQEYYRASHAQRRLWIISQFDENKLAYNIMDVSRFQGELKSRSVDKALGLMAERHESLRTTFFQKEGEIWQHIHEHKLPGFGLLYFDISNDDNKRAFLDRIIRQEREFVFDLEKGPLLRILLIFTGTGEYWFIFNTHHIVSDGWSSRIFLKEMQELYNGLVQDKPSVITPLPVQYRHFSAWQNRLLQSELITRHRAYWLKQLGAEIPVLQLTTDYSRPAVKQNIGKKVSIWIDQEWQTKLRQLAQRSGASMFMVLIACLKGLLYRYTGQQDIIVGTPVAGRGHADLEFQLGLYVNTLVLRSRFSGTDSFKSLLKNVQEVALQAYEYQDYPFDCLVEDLNIRGDRSRNPLFDIMVVYEREETLFLEELQGASVTGYDEVELAEVSKVDLTFNFLDKPNGIAVDIIYNIDLFTYERIQHISTHFNEWIKSVTVNSEQPIQEIDFMDKNEKHNILMAFNNTSRQYDMHVDYAGPLEKQVERTPDNISISFDGTDLTYRELNTRANQLARYLRKAGVQHESLVPVCLDRSIEMMVSILAILKAGAAYVPIDPQYPRERIEYMLKDTNASIVLTTLAALPVLQDIPGITLCCVDDQWEQIAEEAADNLNLSIEPGQLAYVIYTSGSTGTPKGVMIEHSAITNRILWAQEYFGLTEQDAVLQKTTFCFDVSVWELLWPLCVGARLVFALPEGHKDGRYLKSVIEQANITTIHFVPSMLELFLSDIESTDCRNLKRVLCSGEALKPSHVHLFKEKLPHAELHNLYGPTEAAIDVTCWTAPENERIDRVPIGKPVANTRLYIVDGNGSIVPIGVAGELCIGGVQLARGYLNRPELTAERFVEHALWQRIYRTGDIARWLMDGNIEYFGRNDDQVKIRGYRIEPGEIENVLQQCEWVSQAVVTAKKDKEGNNRLVAYIVPEGAFNREGIITWLKARLPEYMVPGIWMEMEALPLTGSGKVNKKALPEADVSALQNTYVAPRNETEQILAEIWQEILDVERVGIQDDFFELGGHSLLAFRLVTAIRKKLDVEVPLKVIFQQSTIMMLARSIQIVQTNSIEIEEYNEIKL